MVVADKEIKQRTGPCSRCLEMVRDQLSEVVGIVPDMANEAVTREFEVTLEVPETDPAEMSGAERRAALVSVGRAEACLAGWKTRLVNAERDQHGVEAVERVLREELQSSRREASRDVKSSA